LGDIWLDCVSESRIILCLVGRDDFRADHHFVLASELAHIDCLNAFVMSLDLLKSVSVLGQWRKSIVLEVVFIGI
jgi:hypothetical protein